MTTYIEDMATLILNGRKIFIYTVRLQNLIMIPIANNIVTKLSSNYLTFEVLIAIHASTRIKSTV